MANSYWPDQGRPVKLRPTGGCSEGCQIAQLMRIALQDCKVDRCNLHFLWVLAKYCENLKMISTPLLLAIIVLQHCTSVVLDLGWVYTVCSGLSVPIFRVNMVQYISQSRQIIISAMPHKKCLYIVLDKWDTKMNIFFISPWKHTLLIRSPHWGASNHYENTPIQIYRKSHLQKLKNFWQKIDIFFLIFAQNIDCGYSLELPQRGSSNEYPQSMFWEKIRKIMYTPVNPCFTI